MPDNSKRNKHMNLDDRIEIQTCLDKGMSFKAIVVRISKDPTIISKEVKNICKSVLSMSNHYRRMLLQNLKLSVPYCLKLLKRSHYCGFQKQLYLAKFAQSEYQTTLSESREGTPLQKASFYEIDDIITAGIKKG